MRPLRLLTPAITALAVAPALMADGRNPGSVLIYPVHNSADAAFSVLSVTNTNVSPTMGSTNVMFEYVNTIPNDDDPFNPFGCFINDRVEALTPADTLSVLSRCHNASDARGYAVVSAQDPNLFKTAWSHNFLAGSELVISFTGGTYSINAIPFESPLEWSLPTDLDGDEKLDFDTMEYEGVPDDLVIDGFVALTGSSLTLLELTGGTGYSTTVGFDVFNDNEWPLSATKGFKCWFEEPLADVSEVFTEDYLYFNTPHDPQEMDIDCDNEGELETGWAIIHGINTAGDLGTIPNPALLGAITDGPGGANVDGGKLLWRCPDIQCNAAFFPFGEDGSCEEENNPPNCVILDQPTGQVPLGSTVTITFRVDDPDGGTVDVAVVAPPGASVNPPPGNVAVPYTATIQWVADTVGDSLFRISVDDGEFTDECPVTVTVFEIDCVTSGETVLITFNEGNLPAGTVITDQFEAEYGLTVEVDAPLTSGDAVIFDSSNPTPSDLDLGTPNEAFGGPGVGVGANAGFNNTEALGNLLIIQNDQTGERNDDPDGGVILFRFNEPIAVQRLTIIDAEETPFGSVRLYNAVNGGVLLDEITVVGGTGDNSREDFTLTSNAFEVRRVEFEFFGSGSIGEFQFCREIR